MSGGGGSNSTTTVQKADPWVGMQPQMLDYYRQVGNFFSGAQPSTTTLQGAQGSAPSLPPNIQQLQQTDPSTYARYLQMFGSGTGGTGAQTITTPGSPAGQMPQFFPGSTLADQSWDTQHAQNWNEARALSGSPLLRDAQALNEQTVEGNYLNQADSALHNSAFFRDNANYINDSLAGTYARRAEQQLASDPWRSAGINLANNTAGGQYVNEANQFFNQDQNIAAGTDLARFTAGGNFLGANPYLNQAYSSATRPIIEQWRDVINPGIASQFAAAGRYGSGAQRDMLERGTSQLGNVLGDTASNIYGTAYENERNRMQASIDPLLRAGQMNLSNRDAERSRQQASIDPLMRAGEFAANNRLAERGLQQQAVGMGQQYGQMQMQAREAERQRQQAAMLAAPGMAQADYYDIDRLAGVGAQRDARSQEALNADIARWDYNQSEPLRRLEAYNALLQGGGGLGFGSNTSRATGPGSSGGGLMGALGGAATAAGVGGALGVTGLAAGTGGLAAMGPPGWAVLGLGALAGSGLFS